MGYTNKTSHYELPQYVANDKPSWLGDFNSAMLKIDTIMADNDATAKAADSAATAAQTQVGAISGQISTIQGQVNTAVDTATSADGKATTAQSVASEANTTAGEAKTLAQVAKQTADNALPVGGGTMTGPLVLFGEPTVANQAATKGYVDARANNLVHTALRKHSNANFTSTMAMDNQGKIVGVSTVEVEYVGVTSVGVSAFIPFARSNSEVNPLGLNVNSITEIGSCYRSRSNVNSFVTLYALYDGTYTYIGTANAQVADRVTPIGLGFADV